jgi:hypothetical protein
MLLLMLAATLLPSSITFAQTISGIINKYQHVIGIDTCDNSAIVAATTGFGVGDRVLIIQMTGATIDTSNTASYGNLLSMGGTGLSEIATVLSIPTASTIRFRDKLLNRYDAENATVQLVFIPQFVDVTVSDTLRPKSWDATTGTGGVFAVEVSGTITLGTPDMTIIDASGCGFRGGVASSSAGGDSVQDYLFDGFNGPHAGAGGYKGGGVARQLGVWYDNVLAAGRGAPANGGGGGNAHNAGGGGGANATEGGRGGDQTNVTEYGRLANGGEPGKGLITSPLRLIMGGGGGGGHQNDHTGTNGASGGGIIYLRAHRIVGTNVRLISDGSSPTDMALSDGAGGGGAGGSIVADIDSVTGNIFYEATGGIGGSSDAQQGSFAFAPGGGGSGGVVHLKATAVAFSRSVLVSGGTAGILSNCTDTTTNTTSYGATAGSDGVSDETADNLPESGIPFIYPSVHDRLLSVCERDSVQIHAFGGDTYQWVASGVQIGTDSMLSIAPSATTVYHVSIQRGNCTYADSVSLTVQPKPLTFFDGPTTICQGSSATYSITPQANTTYSWTAIGGEPVAGDGNTITINWAGPGPDTLLLTASNGICSGSVTKSIKMYDSVIPVVQASVAVLSNAGDSSILSVVRPYANYKWSTGDTTASIAVYSPGEYFVTVIDSNGCTGRDSIAILSPDQIPAIELGLPMLQARPGDRVHVMVNIVRTQNLSKAKVSQYSYVLCVNKTLLALAELSIPFTISGEWIRIPRMGAVSNVLSMNPLDQIDFIAALGDTLESPIVLDSIVWVTNQAVNTTVDTGQFKLIGVCPAGGNRLFSEKGRVLLASIIPNPVSTTGALSYSLAEPGWTSLRIVDVVGRDILSITNTTMPAGDYTATIDASKLSSGYYRLLLRTPSQMFTSLMEVRH